MDELKINKSASQGQGGAKAQAASNGEAAAQFMQMFQQLLTGSQVVATPQLDLSMIPQAAASPAPAKEAAPQVDADEDKSVKREQTETAAEDVSADDDSDADSTAAQKTAAKAPENCQVAPQQAAPVATEETQEQVEEVEAAPVQTEAAATAAQTAVKVAVKAAETAQAQAAAPVVAEQAAAEKTAVAAQTAEQTIAPAAAETAAAPVETAQAVAAAPKPEPQLKSAKVSADDVERYYQSVQNQTSTSAAEAVDAPAQPVQPQTAAAKLPDAAAKAAEAGAQALSGGAKPDSSQLQSSLGQPPRIDGAGKIGDIAGADLTGSRSPAAKAAKAVQGMLESNSGKLVEKIRQMLQNAAEGQTGNTITLKVDPPELGQMTLKVTQRADQIYARITPESKDVEAAVRENAQHIVNVFVSNGVKPENVHLSIGEERMSGFFFGSQMSADDSNSSGGYESRAGTLAVERIFDAPQQANEPAAKAPAQVETGWVA